MPARVHVIVGRGDLDAGWAGELGAMLSDSLRQNVVHLVLDATDILFLDKGLCWILEAQARKLRLYHGRLFIAAAPKKLKSWIHLMIPNLDKSEISFVANEKIALKIIQQGLTKD
jgi:hypothetical protein